MMTKRVFGAFFCLLTCFGCGNSNTEQVSSLNHEDSLVLQRMDEQNRKLFGNPDSLVSKGGAKKDSASVTLKKDSFPAVAKATPVPDKSPESALVSKTLPAIVNDKRPSAEKSYKAPIPAVVKKEPVAVKNEALADNKKQSSVAMVEKTSPAVKKTLPAAVKKKVVPVTIRKKPHFEVSYKPSSVENTGTSSNGGTYVRPLSAFNTSFAKPNIPTPTLSFVDEYVEEMNAGEIIKNKTKETSSYTATAKNSQVSPDKKISEKPTVIRLHTEDSGPLNYFEMGLKKFNEGDYAGCIPLFDKEIEMNPSNIEAFKKRGLAKTELGENSSAINDFTNTTSLESNMGLEALMNMAEIKFKTSDYRGAIKEYNNILAQKLSNSFEIYYNRGLAKAELSMFQDAIKDFNKAIDLFPRYTDSYFQKGVCNMKLEKYKEAVADFTEVVILSPKDKTGHFHRGMAKTYVKDLQGAIHDFSKSILLDPKYEEAYLRRAVAWEKLGNMTETKKDLSSVIDLNPQSKEAYSKRGQIYLKESSYAKAVEDFAKLTSLEPKNGEAYYFKGMGEQALKNYRDACVSFKKAIERGDNRASTPMQKNCNK
jgi:tetratricopeptide (TPR) repeat protein